MEPNDTKTFISDPIKFNVRNLSTLPRLDPRWAQNPRDLFVLSYLIHFRMIIKENFRLWFRVVVIRMCPLK